MRGRDAGTKLSPPDLYLSGHWLACNPQWDTDSLRSLRLGGECGTALSPRRRKGRKENAKKTNLRLGRSVKIRRIRVDPRAIDTHDGPLMDADSTDLRGYRVWQETSGGSPGPRLIG